MVKQIVQRGLSNKDVLLRRKDKIGGVSFVKEEGAFLPQVRNLSQSRNRIGRYHARQRRGNAICYLSLPLHH